MKLNVKILLLLLIAAVNGSAQKLIDSSQSTVTFKISNSGADVKGKLNGLNGEIVFDENDLSTAKFAVNIPIKGLRSGNSMRDEHLCEAEFFDKANYPSITFNSTAIEKKNDHYLLTGDLSLKGITKSVSIRFKYSENKFDGQLILNRTDFGVGGEDYADSIGENVEVVISCVLV